MKRAIYITGVARSGKSTVSKALRQRGYAAHDIEDTDGLFAMYHKETGQLFTTHSNDEIEIVKQADWKCDLEKLRQLM